MHVPQTSQATYTFFEMVERIAGAESTDELQLYADLLMEEKREYALFYLEILVAALQIKRRHLNTFGG